MCALNAFVVAEPNKCIGCKVCEVSCFVAHSDVPLKTVGQVTIPVIPRLYLVKTAEVTMPVQCRHCEDAPCANACPVGAITERDGVIYVDQEACVGCKTCMLACPFGAMEMVPYYKNGERVKQLRLMEETGEGPVLQDAFVASKCDRCLGVEGGPACVANCPREALRVVRPDELRRTRNLEAALAVLESVKNVVG